MAVTADCPLHCIQVNPCRVGGSVERWRGLTV